MRCQFISFFLICLYLLIPPDFVGAEMRSVNKVRVGLPPYDVVAEIVRSNRNKVNAEATTGRPISKKPPLTWLAAASPAIPDDILLNDFKGHLYTVRNLGPGFSSSLASIDFGIHTLRTPVLLITATIDKEAMNALRDSHAHDGKSSYPEVAYLDKLVKASSAGEDAGFSYSDDPWRIITEKYIDQLVNLAVERYRDRITTGRLVVLGSILDVTNIYGRGADSLMIININGDADEFRIKQHQSVKKLQPEMLMQLGRTPLVNKKAGSVKQK